MEKYYTESLNWDFILDKIQNEQCLLVLGPEAFTGEDGISYHDKLIRQLDPPNNKHIRRFYEDEDFYLFENLSKQTLVCYEIQSFYQNTRPDDTLRRIAQIPFHVVFTVTPDKLLNRAFDELGFHYQFGYYKKHKEPQEIKSPTKQNPLLYNLFGCLDSEESLILTHNDLYDYFKSIFARKSMPQLLKDQLRNIRNILFLGVPFDKWYMQLLLRELEIHNADYAFLRFAANQSLPGDIETFCTEQFNINFIFAKGENRKSITQFVSDLHERCAHRGLLRQQGEKELSAGEKIRRSVAGGKMEEALNLLEDSALESELADDVAMLSGRFRNFMRRSTNNLLRENEKEVQEANLYHDILILAGQLST